MNFFHVCSLAITFLCPELEIVDVKELVQTSAMIEVTDMELYCCMCTKNSERLICNRSSIWYSVCLRLIFMWVWGDIKFRYVWKLIIVCSVLSQSLCVWRIHVIVKLLVLIVVIHSNICIEWWYCSVLSMYKFFWLIKFQSCHTLALVKYGIHGSLWLQVYNFDQTDEFVNPSLQIAALFSLCIFSGQDSCNLGWGMRSTSVIISCNTFSVYFLCKTYSASCRIDVSLWATKWRVKPFL